MTKEYKDGDLVLILNPLAVAKNREYDGTMIIGTYVCKLAKKNMVLLADGYIFVGEDYEIVPAPETL